MRIAFLGDSVTEGCFELLPYHDSFSTVKEPQNGYVSLLGDRLRAAYPDRDIEIVNAGIEGNSSTEAFARLKTDVLSKQPDISVVCLGLNDVWMRNPANYTVNLEQIFSGLKNIGSRIIFMTPNMLNTYVHPNVLPCLLNTAKDLADCQNGGVMDEHMQRAAELSKDFDAELCDAYGIWKRMASYGIDTTALLCNYLNHPTREMHRLFADLLFEQLAAML